MTKNIIVTGVSRGLGNALLREFVARGHQVRGCCTQASVAEQLSTEFAPNASVVALDVSQEAAVREWGAALAAQGFTADILVNNAGVIHENAALWEISDQAFTRVMDVNVRGVANMIRVFMPSLLEAKKGTIVNLSSGWGRSTSPMVAPYCASKWAIEGLSQALAQELPAGMVSVALNPGIINTEMLQSTFGADAASYPDADEWVGSAADTILGIRTKDNGRSLSC